MARRRVRRRGSDAAPSVVYSAAEEDAAALFGPDGVSLFLRPSAALVKFFLSVELLTAALIVSLFVAVIGQIAIVFGVLPYYQAGAAGRGINWRLPYPNVSLCDPQALGDNSTAACSVTAFTPGPASILEFPVPDGAIGAAIASTVITGCGVVLLSMHIAQKFNILGCAALVLTIPVFPVGSWLIEAVRSGMFRFLWSGYGAADTTSSADQTPAPASEPYDDGGGGGGGGESSINSPEPAHVPGWAWVHNFLLVTAHPGLLLLRARGEFAAVGDDAASSKGSVFRRVPRAAAYVVRHVISTLGFQWVLAANAVVARRTRIYTFLTLFCGMSAAYGCVTALFIGVNYGRTTVRSDALGLWAAAVATVPPLSSNITALPRHSIASVYGGWAPLGLASAELHVPFITSATATFSVCAALVLLIYSLQASAVTWQLWVAKHIAVVHDVVVFAGFFLAITSFEQIGDVGPVVLSGPAESGEGRTYVPAAVRTVMNDVCGLAGIWACSTQGLNTTRVPFDRVSVTTAHPAPLSQAMRPGPDGVAIPAISAPSFDSLSSAASNDALFTSLPWAMTWTTAVCFLSFLLPVVIAALLTSVRAGYLGIRGVWADPSTSIPRCVFETMGSVFFSILVFPRTIVFFALLSALLIAPCLSLVLTVGVMSPFAKEIHVPFGALLQGLCDVAGKWSKRSGALVVDQGTAAAQVFKSLCDASLPPPPISVSDGFTDAADVEKWIGGAWMATTAPGTLGVDTSDDEEPTDDGEHSGIADPLLPPDPPTAAVPVGPRRIASMGQRERRALITSLQAQLSAAFASVEEHYFSVPESERPLRAVFDFFDAADGRLSEDFALHWVTYRTKVGGGVIDAIVADQARRKKATLESQHCSGKHMPIPSDDDDDHLVDPSAEVGLPLNRSVSSLASATGTDLDIVTEAASAEHPADLFKHFDRRARRDFEAYCKRRVAVTVRWQHRNFPTEQMRYDAAIAHTAAAIDVGGALRREPALWDDVGHLRDAVVADPTPAVPNPEETVSPSVVLHHGDDMFRVYMTTADCLPLPQTEVVSTGNIKKTNPVAWFDEESFAGRLPFFGIATAGLRQFFSFIRSRRWLLHHPNGTRFLSSVDDEDAYMPPFFVLSVVGHIVYFIVSLIDVPLVLATCRQTTSTWEVQPIGNTTLDCSSWKAMLKPHLNFTQIGGATEHSYECVPPLGLALYAIRIVCLLLLCALFAPLRRLFSRGFLWSLAAAGVPRADNGEPPWVAPPTPDAEVPVSELRVGAVRHTVNAAALEHVMTAPASEALQLAIECVVDAVTPHPTVALLSEVSHEVLPRALTVRVVSPYLPTDCLL